MLRARLWSALVPARPAYRVETERLVLRCYEPADAPLLNGAVAASREHLEPWMPWASASPDTLPERVARLREWRAEFDRDESYVYGIFDPGETQVLGSSGLHARVGPNALEVGYWIHVDHVRRGYATEAAAALTRVAFEVNGVERVEVHCAVGNEPSARIPRRLGFHHEATLRRRILDGAQTLVDVQVFTLFADEYAVTPSASAQVRAFDAAGAALL
jgi:RimJ/RimL family protein N-acetyltransferase